jgi:hypothetical protein
VLGNIGRGAWQTSAGKVSCSQAHLAHVCLKAPKKIITVIGNGLSQTVTYCGMDFLDGGVSQKAAA